MDTAVVLDRLTGHAGAAARSGVLHGWRRNRARETGRVFVERGNGTGGLLGVSRREEVAREKQEVARGSSAAMAWSPRSSLRAGLGKTTREGEGGVGRGGPFG